MVIGVRRGGIIRGQGSAAAIAVVTTGEASRTPHVGPTSVSRITRSVVPGWCVNGCWGQSCGRHLGWHTGWCSSGGARVGATSRTVTRTRRTRGRDIWRLAVWKTQRGSKTKAEKIVTSKENSGLGANFPNGTKKSSSRKDGVAESDANT